MKKWLMTTALMLTLLAVLAGYKYTEITAEIAASNAIPEYSVTVEASYAEKIVYTPTVTSLGVAVAPQQLTLRNEQAGYITEVYYQSGAQVQKGEVIIQMDISEQKADLLAAKAKEKSANSSYLRAEKLGKTNYLSEETIEQSLSNLRVIKADIARINSIINRRTIKAPFTGILGIHQLRAGEYLNIDTELASFVGQNQGMWIDFSIPQFYGSIALGTQVQTHVVRTEAKSVQANMAATIIAADTSLSANARSQLYRAFIPQHVFNANDLIPNTALKVTVPVGESQTLYSIPSRAIRHDQQHSFVFQLSPAGDGFRAKKIPVEIIKNMNSKSYVVGELTTSVQIATAGSFKLYEGLLTHIKPQEPTAEVASW